MSIQAREEQSLITEQFLMDRLGPAPTVARVASFLEEAVSTTWRRLKEGQLQALQGAGTTRINLRSLVAFLNGGYDYKLTHKRGKKARPIQSKAEGRAAKLGQTAEVIGG